MQALQKAMNADGVVWLQVNSSAEGKQGNLSPEAGEALRESQGVHSTAMLLDASGEVGRAYDARVTPLRSLLAGEFDGSCLGGSECLVDESAKIAFLKYFERRSGSATWGGDGVAQGFGGFLTLGEEHGGAE